MGGASVRLFRPRRFVDQRGWFSETFNQARLAAAGIDVPFVQDNHSYSAGAGTIRGLHFQRPPHTQAKLVRCVRCRAFDVSVDLRRGSPSYGHWVAVELSAEGGEVLFVPAGFGHGFATLTPDVEIVYKVSDYYAPECDAGIIWNDPLIGIDWPISADAAILSEKDACLPPFHTFDSPFAFDGAPLAPLVLEA